MLGRSMLSRGMYVYAQIYILTLTFIPDIVIVFCIQRFGGLVSVDT